MVHFTTLAPEILQLVCTHVFVCRSLLFEQTRKEQKHFPKARPEEWDLDILTTCRLMHIHALAALKSTLAKVTVTYQGFTPSPPTIRGHAQVTDFESDVQRAKNFVRHYSYYVKHVQILDWSKFDNMSLDMFGKLQTLTLGPILIKPMIYQFPKLDVDAVLRPVTEMNFDDQILKDFAIRVWKRYLRWASENPPLPGPTGYEYDRSWNNFLNTTKEDNRSQTRGRQLFRDMRLFDLRCCVIIDFTGLSTQPLDPSIRGIALIDCDTAELLEMEPCRHGCLPMTVDTV